MRDCDTSSLKETHRSQFFENELPTMKRRPKIEKPQSNEPSIKMESETSMEKSPKNVPLDHFSQVNMNMPASFPGFMGMEQFIPYPTLNGDPWNSQFMMNFFKAFNTFQGLMNFERVICNPGLYMGIFFFWIFFHQNIEQVRNSSEAVFKQRMNEMHLMKANEKK